ncbi:MAG: hypothetical protein ACE5F7_00870 [Nitrospiria bacterium]
MEKNRNAHSFDLVYARAVTHRLRQHSAEETPCPQSDEPDYIRFSSAPFFQASAAVKPERVPAVPDFEMGEHRSFGPEAWEKLLDWSLDLTGADTAFLMDDTGLTVASKGELSGDAAEAVGSRLMLAFEQGDQMAIAGQQTRSISFELDTLWVTGLSPRSSGDALLMICLISAAPVEEGARRRLEKAVLDYLG